MNKQYKAIHLMFLPVLMLDSEQILLLLKGAC